ncbi:MAG: tetratricopeptide repeat protein [Ignavibacteriales bacterium]|nr:tetratricopeptide repeat protein [Ignavibacteriales bacterium]
MKKYSLLLIISLLIISCSKTSDQEYLDQSNKLLTENKIPEAVKSLETLLNEYPESNLAPKALVQLAGIYQNQQIEGLTSKKSLEKAEQYYYQVYEKYPNSEEAPLALFQAGILLDDALKNYDEATKIYNLFLEKYPNDKHAVIVKQSLDIMGIDPNDIINKKEAAKD